MASRGVVIDPHQKVRVGGKKAAFAIGIKLKIITLVIKNIYNINDINILLSKKGIENYAIFANGII